MITFNERERKIIRSALLGNNIFLHGAGGVGKTVILQEIKKRLLADNRKVAVTATTGAAAINVGGGTLHRFAGIGLGKDSSDKLLDRVKTKSGARKRWLNTHVLIIDEVSMLGAELFDKINYVAQKIRENQKPMGGIQVIFSGDLLQLPPINDKWIFESETWPTLDLKTYSLNIPKRYSEKDYFEMLLRFRQGVPTKHDLSILEQRHQEYLKVKNEIKKWDIKPTILYSKRDDVDYYNETELEKLDTPEFEFEAYDDFQFTRKMTKEQKEYYIKILNDAIPAKITLKVGAQVMLKKNLDTESKLVNGSRGVVVDINPELGDVKVKFQNGVTTTITTEMWEIEDDNMLIIRTQIPLVLAWSYTIHKAQGATLDCAIADLGRSVFAYSQGYVALSRVRDLNNLYLTDFDKFSIRADPTALEYVRSIKDADFEDEIEEFFDPRVSEDSDE